MKLSIETDDDIISDTIHTIYGYKLRCIKRQIKLKTKWKLEERWYCLKEGEGKDLPVYVREGTKRTGFKSYNSFFAMAGFYKTPNSTINYKTINS